MSNREISVSFLTSLRRLEESLRKRKTLANRDSAIQRFEFTFELAWKCIQHFLRKEGVICRSPNECLKEAFKVGWIQDDPAWLRMLHDRNLTVHTYDEKQQKKFTAIFQTIFRF